MHGFEDVDVGLTPKLSGIMPGFLNYIRAIPTSSPVNSSKLSKHFSIRGEEVRALVSYLRSQGYLITSTQRGYAYAIDPDDQELVLTLAHLRERADRINSLIESLQMARARLRTHRRGGLQKTGR